MRLKMGKGEGGAAVAIQVTPRASKNEIVGSEGGHIKVRLTAPPVDGAANEALIALLADKLGIAKKRISIVAGESSRSKLVAVMGMLPAEVEARLLEGSK